MIRVPVPPPLRWLAVPAVIAATSFAAGDLREPVIVGEFSAVALGEAPPPGWKELTFPKIARHTRYRLVKEDDTVVVRADARASASGLVRELSLTARDRPLLRWRWKVSRPLEGSDLASKRGDDYAARLYVTFEYDPARLGLVDRVRSQAARLLYGVYPPTAALSYVWASHAAIETMAANVYSNRTMMFVVESGAEKAGRWVEEQRDLLADYRRAFGGEPPPISGVAIMSDTDDTSESVTAWYGDIVLAALPEG